MEKATDTPWKHAPSRCKTPLRPSVNSLAPMVRAVEDCALGEIDRARQETREVQGRLVAASRQSAAAEKSLRELIELANSNALEASCYAVAQHARADAFEGQLGTLRVYPRRWRLIRSSAGPGDRGSRAVEVKRPLRLTSGLRSR